MMKREIKMGGQRLSYPACVLAGQQKIQPQDVLILRKHVFPDGIVSAEDAIALMEIHRSGADKCPEWDTYFIESLTAFIVEHSWPQGSLDDVNGRWLKEMIAPDGVIATAAELDLLIHVIDVARSVPDYLSALAIDQLRLALERGTGAYSERREIRRPGISEQDVAHVVRVLKGACNHGHLMLTHRENRVLSAIDRLVEAAPNHPSCVT